MMMVIMVMMMLLLLVLLMLLLIIAQAAINYLTIDTLTYVAIQTQSVLLKFDLCLA